MWQEEYFRIMSAGLISLEEIGKARDLKSANIPPSIFKYREVNEYSLQNLESDTVWLCSANQYNDPYDCCCTFDILTLSQKTSHLSLDEFLSKAEIPRKFSQATIDLARKSTDPVQYLLKSLIEQDPLPENSQRELTEMLNHVTLSVGDDMISQMNAFFQQSTKICSFSEINDSIAMWGHYARSHQGICIEYEFCNLEMDDIRRHALMPVRYSNQLFNATKYLIQGIGKNSFNNLFALIAAAHKSIEWSYEKEWRLVIPIGTNEPDRNYHMPKPKVVYIGTKITSENERVVREICERRCIPVKRMRLSQREFRLEAE
jgi:hypothetical protein